MNSVVDNQVSQGAHYLGAMATIRLVNQNLDSSRVPVLSVGQAA